MSVRRCLPAVAAATLAITSAGFGQLRVVSYNVATLNGDLGAMGDVVSAFNADDIPGYALAPHVYVLQEVDSGDKNTFLTLLNLNAPPGVSYAAATYTNGGEQPGAQALFFRTDTLFEIASDHRDIASGAGRDADRWHLAMVGYDNDDASIWVYGMHLKASPGGDNEDQREAGALAVRADANALPPGRHVIYAGDFNLYSNLEPAYGVLTATGAAQGIDAYGFGSWGGSGNAMKHSQSPRLVSGGDLVGGGMDDRFDFILYSPAFDDGAGFAYLGGTMRSVGNDGNHYNDAINNGNNSYYPGQVSRSNALADDLHEASDHIPVMAEFRIPGLIEATLAPDFGRIIQGAVVFVPMTVANGADVVVTSGADTINYNAVPSGDLVGGGSGLLPPLAAPQSVIVVVDTAFVGPASGQVTLTSTTQGAGGSGTVLDTSGTVVRGAAASFDAGSVVTGTSVPWTVDADTGVQTLEIPVHNVGWDALQARLDLDGVSGVTSPVVFAGGLATDIEDEPAILSFTVSTNGLAPGDYDQMITIATSDEDLPGAESFDLALDILLTVEGGTGGMIGDVDGDGDVDFNDLVSLLAAWGPCPAPPAACDADFDENGVVDFADLLALLAAWS